METLLNIRHRINNMFITINTVSFILLLNGGGRVMCIFEDISHYYMVVVFYTNSCGARDLTLPL